MKIPINDLKRQYKAIEKEAKNKLSELLENQAFILGKDVEELEGGLSRYCGTKYAVGVNSGTDALIVALEAMGIKPGDEVITTPFTFIATAEAIVRAGAKPVFVDIDRETFNIDPMLIEEKITARTKAILPVHLYGLCADMDKVIEIAKRHNLKILEDLAQAIGSEYKGKRAGSMGDAGAISFYPGKNLGCFGDGGMLVTNDRGIHDRAKLIRNHGSDERYKHKLIGYNSRLDNIQAAILNIKLKHLDGWIEKRMEIARFFTKELKGLPLSAPLVPDGYRHSFHLYVPKSDKAPEIVDRLNQAGIESRTYYPIPLHLQECFSYLGYKQGDLPVSEEMSRKVFAIPIYAELTRAEQAHIVGAIRDILVDTCHIS